MVSRPGLRHLLTALSLLGIVVLAAAVKPEPPPDTELQRAHDLCAKWQYEEARKLYAHWVQVHPDDAHAWFDYAYTIYLEGAAESDPARGNALRKLARDYSLKSRALGCDDALLDGVLQSVGPDGADLRGNYSTNPKADALVAKAEQAFSSGEMEAAIKLYADALAIDPKSYFATLFTGDAYFNRNDYDRAMEWFAKATVLNPDRETAWRYWGDALMHLGRNEEARDKYAEAVVAEPYARLPREALQHHAETLKTALHQPEVALPRTQITIKDGKTVIEQPADADAFVLVYNLARAAWLGEERGHYFAPNAAPRHSLPEELAGLRAVCEMGAETLKNNPGSSPAWKNTLTTLQSLDRDGLLEAYVLLDRGDEGISLDYPTYRLENRAVLLRYVRQIWCGLK